MTRVKLLSTTLLPEAVEPAALILPVALAEALSLPEPPVHIRGQHNLRKAFTPAKG